MFQSSMKTLAEYRETYNPSFVIWDDPALDVPHYCACLQIIAMLSKVSLERLDMEAWTIERRECFVSKSSLIPRVRETIFEI